MRKLFTTIILLLAVLVANAQAIGGVSSNNYSSRSQTNADAEVNAFNGFVLRADVSLGYSTLWYGLELHNAYGLEVGYRYRRHEFGVAIDFLPLYGAGIECDPLTNNHSYSGYIEGTGLSMPIYAYWKFYFLKKKVTPFLNVGLGGCAPLIGLTWHGETRDHVRGWYEERIQGIYFTLGIGCSFNHVFNLELQNVCGYSAWKQNFNEYYSSYDNGGHFYYAIAVKFSVNFMELSRILSSRK